MIPKNFRISRRKVRGVLREGQGLAPLLKTGRKFRAGMQLLVRG